MPLTRKNTILCHLYIYEIVKKKWISGCLDGGVGVRKQFALHIYPVIAAASE